MPIVAIDHIQLAMPPGKEDVARAFYQDLLGIPEVEKPPQLARRGGAWFEQGPLKLHLGVEADFHPARKAHPALIAEGLEELVKRLKANGIDVIDEPLDGHLRVYIADPFGNRLELLEPTGEGGDRHQTLLDLEQRLALVGQTLSSDEAAHLIADDFVEFGSSGKVWRKAEVVEAIATRPPIDREVKNFAVTELSASTCLVTYESRTASNGQHHASSTLRSSIWRCKSGEWQLIFHQGTSRREN